MTSESPQDFIAREIPSMGLERQRPVVLLASRPEPSPRESQFRRLLAAKAGGPERRATLAAMPAPSLTGGCLSGGFRFGSLSRRGSRATATVLAASVAPERLRRHRRGIDGRTFRLLQREELVKARRHPDGGLEKCFCHECAAHLFSRNPRNPRR